MEKLILTAAKKGNVEAIRALLTADPELLNARDSDGSTPLHCASWKGHPDAVQLLIETGADVDARNQNDHYGTTPLHAAAHGNQTAVARLLLEAGADPSITNLHGRTPLDETTVHGATAVAKLLRSIVPAERP